MTVTFPCPAGNVTAADVRGSVLTFLHGAGIGVWYELFDRYGNGPVVSVPLRMKQGDEIRLGLRFSANHSMLSFSWMNLTRHTTATRTVRNAGKYYNGSTAEWIVERPGIDRLTHSPNLAWFSPIVFTTHGPELYERRGGRCPRPTQSKCSGDPTAPPRHVR